MNEEMTYTKEANNAKKEKKELISPLSFLLLLTELSNNIVVQCLFWEVLRCHYNQHHVDGMIEMIINGKMLFQISRDNRPLESFALLVPKNTVCHAATATNHCMMIILLLSW